VEYRVTVRPKSGMILYRLEQKPEIIEIIAQAIKDKAGVTSEGEIELGSISVKLDMETGEVFENQG